MKKIDQTKELEELKKRVEALEQRPVFYPVYPTPVQPVQPQYPEHPYQSPLTMYCSGTIPASNKN